MVEMGDHYRPTTEDHRAGTYRVVGAPDDVTLLGVADEDGRRCYTGTLLHVPEATLETAFEPASDPDAGIRPVATVRNGLQGLYWSVRRFFPA